MMISGYFKVFKFCNFKTSCFCVHHHFHRYIQYELLLENYYKSLMVYQQLNCQYIVKNIQQNKTQLSVYKSVLITNPTGFGIAFTNVEATVKQCRDNVMSTLFQRRTATLYQRCATLKIRRRVLLHLQRQINVISTLKQR